MIPSDLSLLHAPGTPALSLDGAFAVVSRTAPDLDSDEYTGHLWRVATDGSAPPVRLTRGHRDTDPQVSPDGTRVAFLRAEPQGRPQLFVVETTGGEPVRLTDAPLGAGPARWSPDGTALAFLARVPEEGRYVAGGDSAAERPRHITELPYRHDGVGFTRDKRRQLFVVEVPADLTSRDAVPTGEDAAPTVRQVTDAPTDVEQLAWFPGGRYVAAVAARHAAKDADLRGDAVLVDTAPGSDGALVPLTDADAGSTLAVAAVLPATDGSALWLLAQDMGPSGRDFVAAQTGLFRLPLTDGATPAATGAPERLTDVEAVDLDPGTFAVTADGVLVGVLHRGTVLLREVRADASTRDLLAGDVVAHGVAAVPGVPVAVVTAAGPQTSGDVHAVDLATGGARVLTDWSAPLRATGRVRTPREVTTTAPDGYPVHGWLVTPDPERFAGPHPTILMIHGGPYAQYTVGLFDEVQTLAEQGYAVVYGNPRGAAGYGSAHGSAIRHGFGTVDTDDVLALLDAALTDPALDAERVGVMGGSYGGYLTAWLTTRTDRFRAAIVERGFLDPVSFVGSSDIGWFFGLEYLGDGDDDAARAAVAAQSPMAHVHRVTTPTLVIHSEQDWRCPVEQGQRWFVELKRRGVPAELLLFPGEGHELTRSGRPQHRLVRFEHVLEWWQRALPVTPA
ncbi:S9 family peptidase [Cellulomonas triticagri]|uniref:S9 family peptidase n=1 Tax=Cellulomonas triticagri TaxID=2483352 RepID=A0A3M2J499_9CELL|nr:S9 family peptidase [Cellulomonas triticagri]RMI08917.1 S9 family peptidase [Cellulomonas triticagri]